MENYTYEQTANNLDLWIEYCCCGENSNNINSDHFNSMTVQERIDFQTDHWGKEFGADFGIVDFCGEKLEIIQNPYASSNIGEEDYYTAEAQCINGQLYKVLWKITNADCEDESDACDWNNYDIVRV